MREWTRQEKKSLLIFGLTAFALPYALGILMGISHAAGRDVSIFPSAQMFYPAAGVMLAMLVTRREDAHMPKRCFRAFLLVTALMVFCAVGSAVVQESPWTAASNIVIIVGTLFIWLSYFRDGREQRAAYGLRLTQTGGSNPFVPVLVFVLLYIVRLAAAGALMVWREPSLADGAAQETDALMFGINLISLPISFLLAFAPFLGEEYGWRGFLQPLLQKRFGPRTGVMVLGVLWGVWHLPINLYYYSPETWQLSFLQQIFVCICYSVFFGWAYAKTNSIWTAVIIHFLNNNAVVLFASPDAVSNQVLTGSDVALNIFVMCVLYLPFLASGVFRKSALPLPRTEPVRS